jgi:phosphoribosylanthranilate isomerase
MVEIKFCGLTRAADAAFAGELGAAYLGVVFAGGPRTLEPDRAALVLDGCSTDARRVGVFGRAVPDEIARVARAARLDVVQMHGDPTVGDIAAVRQRTGAELWAVVRVTNTLPPDIDELFDAADAVLIDARVAGSLGGNGVRVDWSALRPHLDGRRRVASRRVVLAGGLEPGNVPEAVATLQPDVVDVSSGVELAPGIKDHARMRAFAAAVADARQERR